MSCDSCVQWNIQRVCVELGEIEFQYFNTSKKNATLCGLERSQCHEPYFLSQAVNGSAHEFEGLDAPARR